MSEADAFYVAEGDALLATGWTRGPWSDEHQHAGPPAALLARAVEGARSAPDLFVSRLTIELLRPIPIGALRLEATRERSGRSVERIGALLLAGGEVCAVASALCVRERPVALPEDVRLADRERPAPPAASAPWSFDFFRHPVAYHRAVEGRLARGAWGSGDVLCWLRQRLPLVAGETPTPLQRVLVAADAGSGVGAALDPARYTFVNADLTVALARPLEGEWVGMGARTRALPSGIGLCDTELRDEAGPIGRALQCLVLAAR